MTATGAASSRTGPGVVIAIATAVQTLISAGTLTLPAIAPQAALALGIEPVLIGLQVSIVYAAAAIASLFGGRCVRRFGAARTSQAALLFLTAGLMLATVPSLPCIALGSAVMGAAYGLPGPAAAHLLHRYTAARHRNLVFSLKQTGVPLGGVLAGLAAPRLAAAIEWRAPLIAAAAGAAGLALVIGLVRSSWDDDRQPNASLSRAIGEPILAMLRVRGLRALAGVGFLLAGVQLCVIAFAVLLLVSDFGFTPVAAGSVLAAAQMAGALGRISWGLLADRFRDGRRVLLGVALATALLLLTLQAGGFVGPVPILVCLGATAIGWNGVFLAEVARLAPERRVGDATAIVLAGTYLGVCIGPALFTAAAPHFPSYSAAFILLALSSLAAVGLLLAGAAGRRPDPPLEGEPR